MSFKTIFIIVISVLVTVILMNNTDEIDFWIFGEARIPKLTILGSMFGIGLLVGFVAGRPRKKLPIATQTENVPGENQQVLHTENRNQLSDEDREYIK
ncbi:MAG: hypothetical protein ACYCZO_11305 [Daejeonella sp.]